MSCICVWWYLYLCLVAVVFLLHRVVLVVVVRVVMHLVGELCLYERKAVSALVP